jgi:K+-transporting ATPase KdpF subunit
LGVCWLSSLSPPATWCFAIGWSAPLLRSFVAKAGRQTAMVENLVGLAVGMALLIYLLLALLDPDRF